MMMRNSRRHILWPAAGCFALMLPCLPMAGQTGGTGALTVTVTDQTGALIGVASVPVSNSARALSRAEVTGANGSYTFTLLPPGDYAVKIAAPGFTSLDVPSVPVKVT